MQVFTTLRSGGDFLPKHVQALSRQVLKWSPIGTTFTCLSDVEIPGVTTIPFKTDWPTWWGKFELCDPSIKGDLLFMDIDTVVVGPIDDFMTPGPVATYLGCGALMWWPEGDRKVVGEVFRADPERIIEEYWGEDIFLRAVGAGQYTIPRTFPDLQENKRKWTRDWAVELPGQVAFRPKGLQPCLASPRVTDDTRIIIFSGSPRPWQLREFKGLYR